MNNITREETTSGLYFEDLQEAINATTGNAQNGQNIKPKRARKAKPESRPKSDRKTPEPREKRGF